jgi:sialate O-acetylesterase
MTCTVVLALLGVAQATILLPAYTSSGMVLQREVANNLWGLDTPGASVSVSLPFGTFNSTADASGRFQVVLPSQPATSASFSMTFESSASPTLVLSDVVIGDVWVCSGSRTRMIS